MNKIHGNVASNNTQAFNTVSMPMRIINRKRHRAAVNCQDSTVSGLGGPILARSPENGRQSTADAEVLQNNGAKLSAAEKCGTRRIHCGDMFIDKEDIARDDMVYERKILYIPSGVLVSIDLWGITQYRLLTSTDS